MFSRTFLRSLRDSGTARVRAAAASRTARCNSGSAAPARAKPFLSGWKLAAGVVSGAVVLKCGHAILPLRASQPATHEADVISHMALYAEEDTHVDARAALWIMMEGSDRLIRDVYTALACIVDYVVSSRGTEDWSAIHQRGAERILKLCQVNRGVYIKLGQIVAQMEYLLPVEYVDTMRVMTHAAPQDTFDQVRRMVEEELGGGRKLEDVYSEFSVAPIASASLAQVNRARLRETGEEVAVKVQHHGLRQTSTVDIKTVAYLVHTVRKLFPKFDYTWLADEIRDFLPNELDFLKEAANCKRAGDMFAGRTDVVVPRIYDHLSSSRVLVMSFENGSYANDVAAIKAAGLKNADVAALVSTVFSEQIFVHGLVHCDPHAANMLIRRGPDAKPQLVLLDHGTYRVIPRDLRLNYSRLWRSIINGDEAGIREYSTKMGAGSMYQLWASMLTTRTWDDLMTPEEEHGNLAVRRTKEGMTATRENSRKYAEEIGVVLRHVPRELIMILKTNDCLRSVDYQLGSPVNTFVIMSKVMQRTLQQEEAPLDAGWSHALYNAYDNALLAVKLKAAEWYMWWRGE